MAQSLVRQVVSGGQTGADRAALDAALEAGISTGGWCPRGRRAEDGVISESYPLCETPEEQYEQRTSWNVRDSDGTLVLVRGEPVGGTAFTIHEAVRLGRPYLVVEPNERNVADVQAWLRREGIRTLNVAGPRESTVRGMYDNARRFMRALLRGVGDPDEGDGR